MNFTEAYIKVLSHFFDPVEKWQNEWIRRNFGVREK